jgi:hypothetical protein
MQMLLGSCRYSMLVIASSRCNFSMDSSQISALSQDGLPDENANVYACSIAFSVRGVVFSLRSLR